jgi:hypothetical protein
VKNTLQIGGYFFAIGTVFILLLEEILVAWNTSLYPMKKCILLIEDNDPIRENTAELLELADYEVMQ